jgi:aminoglycoside/choline kinase family phosphotransferase
MKLRDDTIRFAREALGIPESVTIELSSLKRRGSDRTFFRLKWTRKDSAILIRYDPRRLENSYYADIAAFLHGIDVPVPRLIYHDSGRCLTIIEDLGEIDLWSLKEIPWESRRALYQKTLTIAHRLHSFPEKEFPSGRVKLMEDFGLDLYRWERNYFRDHFVSDFCGIKLEPSFERELEAELFDMAERLVRTRRSLLHRDLQSQNVMIRDEEPVLVDFQGMRFGSPFYDLGSLLCDPYVSFLSPEREELLSFYYKLTNRNLDWSTFQNSFWEASAQRLMQCLGAYGFLGLKKGLKAYIEHIPAGLTNLQLAADRVASLRRLPELSAECRRMMEERE